MYFEDNDTISIYNPREESLFFEVISNDDTRNTYEKNCFYEVVYCSTLPSVNAICVYDNSGMLILKCCRKYNIKALSIAQISDQRFSLDQLFDQIEQTEMDLTAEDILKIAKIHILLRKDPEPFQEILEVLDYEPWNPENKWINFALDVSNQLFALKNKSENDQKKILYNELKRNYKPKSVVFVALLCSFRNLVYEELSKHKNELDNDWIGLILIYLFTENNAGKINYYCDRYNPEGMIGDVVDLLALVYFNSSIHIQNYGRYLETIHILKGMKIIDLITDLIIR